jgi:cell division protein FtsQ
MLAWFPEPSLAVCHKHMSRILIILVVALIVLAMFLINGSEIEKISVSGDLSPNQRQQLEDKLLPWQTKNFFFLDFAAMEASLEELSWLNQVRTKRVWPREIRLLTERSSIIARWRDEAYLSSTGELIYMEGGSYNLPRLSSVSRSTHESLEYFRLLQQYAKREGLDMIDLEEDDFGDWRITFKPGWQLLLRSDLLEEKMERFLEVYGSTLKQKEALLVSVDARYDNAYAVRLLPGAELK